ncbi:unnamed protein product [Closterium sp. NIES-54]
MRTDSRNPTQRRNFLKSTLTSATLRRSIPWRKKRNLCDAKRKSFANGALWSRAAHSPGADGAKRSAPSMKGGGEALVDGARATLADGEPQLAATPADGAPHLAVRQADGALSAKAGGLPARTKGGKKRKLRQDLYDPWDTIDWGNEPSTPCHTVYGPAPKPREPTFFPGTIPGTNIPLSTILDREFLALMLTTANGDNEAEETVAEPAQASDKDPAEAHARYMRTSGFCANDAIWHQRPGHPSRVTLKNCIEAGVFAPGALLRPDGTKVRGATHPRNCTVYPEAALGHQPFPLLEPGTNRYAKLEKVYSDFLNVGHCGINDELYMLTFIDARMRYVWVINVEARSRAYENWQSDGTAEFRSKEMQDYLAQKGIEHHVSLPYAHQQQGVAERTNRTLMTKVRTLMKQSKLLPTYWTYAMHHDVRVHNLLSTTAITGNSSPHVKWTGTKGNTSMLRVWGCMVQHCPPTSTIGKFASRARWGIHLGISHEHKAWLILDLMSQKVKNAHDVIFYERLFLRQFREDEQANTNRVYANNGHSYASPENEVAAAILEQDPRGEFTRGDHGDNDDDSLGGGAGAAGGGGSGSGRGAAQPAPPEPESDDDDVQEFIPQHRHDSTVSGLQLLGLHTATSTAPCVIEPKNLCQALTGPHSKEWREVMDAEIKALESCDTWVLVNRAAIKGRRIFSGKWMFRVKTAADGTIERFRARWVIRGYDQRHIIDFDQKFAPNTFLYALVDAIIYVEQPHTYAKYAEELGKRFNIAPAPLSTPYRTLGPNHKPDNKALYPAGLHTYQKQLGCLLFASITCRPDFSYIASQLAHYVDADHAADPDNRQSRKGFLFRLEPSGPISWNSQKQELVALSSAEAEFIAATAAICEGLYLQELLQEAKILASPNFRLHNDNQSAIRIANKPGFINRTKHIALPYFFVKDEVDKGKVDLTYCPTGDMAADFPMKKLSRQQYQHCSELSGVVKRVKTRYSQE